MEDDDDVPPLEDMTELLQQAKQMKSQEESSSSYSSSIPVKSTSSKEDHHGNASLTTSSREAKEELKSKKDISPKRQETTKSVASSSGFGGMKKGFLFGGPSNKTNTSAKSKASSIKSSQKPGAVEEIPVIRPKEGSGDGKDRYRMDEVQEALKATAPLLQNKEWITDDLLTKLEKHPGMAKKLTDPRYAQAVQKFQSNPQQAMQEYKDNQDVQQFFKDFCGLLGEHFSSMGGGATQPSPTSPSPSIRTQDASSGADMAVRSSTNPNQATAADEAKMQQILSNPEIREIMMDQRIQRLMEALRSNPDQGQRILQSAGPDVRSKVHKLIEAGLLGFTS